MCDTLVALPSATADGSTLFAKNSDREPNEAQAIRYYPPVDYNPGATVRCTYVAISQARRTHAIVLSQPFWMWGAEMGANEHGVVIGNEALFTKVKVPGSGLTGMDLVRLGLERAASARDAVAVITSLVEQYGQGGSGGYQHKFYYHNSFLIADRRSAWIVETAGREWAARQVREGSASISNGLTIGRDYDLASGRLVADAVQRHWCRSHDDFDFAACYSDVLYTTFSGCRRRQPQTAARLASAAGHLAPADLMATLRSHGPAQTTVPATPASLSNGSVCMHYADNLIRVNQTTASMVAHLRADGSTTLWMTGTAAPCLSIFKPFYIDVALPDLGPLPGGVYDPATLWWQGERLHRAVLLDYAGRYPCVGSERDALEARWLAEEAGLWAAEADARSAFSARCSAEAYAAMSVWTESLANLPVRRPAPWLYRRNWSRQSHAAHVPPPKLALAP